MWLTAHPTWTWPALQETPEAVLLLMNEVEAAMVAERKRRAE